MRKLPVDIHPAAEIFPWMEGEAYESLKRDIAENGVQVPMTFYDGMLLDGRNRYRACLDVGIDPELHTEELDVDLVPDPVAWVLSTNLHRRHLSETQREAIAAQIATMKQGGDRKSPDIKGQNCTLIEEAAEQLSVKPRSVKNAKAAIKGGCKELLEMMQADKITSSLAAKFVKAVPDKKKQKAILKDGIDAVRQAVKDYEFEQKELKEPKPSPRVYEATSEQVLTPNWDDYEDVPDDEPQDDNRIGRIIDMILRDYQPYEWIVIGERLIEAAK